MSLQTALPRWSIQAQGPEYGFLVPAMAGLPASLAYPLSGLRGRFNARHDRDWVSLSLGHRHVAAMAAEGYRQFLPPEVVDAALIERFETVAREEMEARALHAYGLSHFDVDIADGLARLAQRPRNRGLVLITAHLETFVLGIAALASTGERIHPVMSKVSEDPRIAPAVRAHFRLKYEGLQRHLQGGALADAETSMRHFYRALARGEIVVVLADSPPPPGATGECVPWLGTDRGLAQGALRLACRSGSLLGAFACHYLGGRRHSVSLSPLHDPSLNPQGSYAAAFEFLEQHIRRRPGRWWASHLLPLCLPCSLEKTLKAP